MVSTRVLNARDVGSILTRGALFPIFCTYHDAGAVTRIMDNLCDVWLLNLPCICMMTVYMYVIVSIKRNYYSRETSVVHCTDL